MGKPSYGCPEVANLPLVQLPTVFAVSGGVWLTASDVLPYRCRLSALRMMHTYMCMMRTNCQKKSKLMSSLASHLLVSLGSAQVGSVSRVDVGSWGMSKTQDKKNPVVDRSRIIISRTP